MRLTKVEIQDFKSIKDETLFLKNNITCLIGKNESGKSSILEAISYVDYFKLFDSNKKLKNKSSTRKENPYPAIKATFELSGANRFQKTIEVYDKFFIMPTFENFTSIFNTQDSFYVEFMRWGDGVENLEINLFSKDQKSGFNLFDNLQDKNNKNEIAELFINHFLPVIQLYTEEDLTVKAASIEELNSDKSDFETLRRLLKIGGCPDFNFFETEDDNDIDVLLNNISFKITKLFNTYYIQDQSIDFKINYRNKKITISLKDATDQYFTLDERSPGFRYFFAFVINKRYLTLTSNKPHIFLLDEPGATLFPHGCRDLLKTFDFFSKDCQIIYTTHNVFLTLRNDLDSLIFTEKNVDKGTIIVPKTYKNKFQIFRKELGILLNDSFLIGDVNIIVEGDTEHFVLRQIISEIVSENENFNSLEWLNIYNSDGVTEIENALRYLSKSLNLSGIVLMDSDEEAEKIANKAAFKTLINSPGWELIQINDLFIDKKARTFEDLFPSHLYIKAYNDHYGNGQFDFDNTFTRIEENASIEPPILDHIKTHYLNLFSEGNRKNKSISKVNIIRILMEEIKKLDDLQKKDALKNIIKLIETLKSKSENLIHGNN